MEVIYFLLPAAILMSSVGLALFVWALRSGQYEDLEGPRWRVLYEDDSAPLASADVAPAKLAAEP